VSLLKKIIVGVDGSEESDSAVKKAIELAKPLNAKIILVHVVSHNLIDVLGKTTGEDSEKLKAKFLAEGKKILEHDKNIVENAGLEVETKLLEGSPANEIIEEASRSNADLIVVGSRGIHGARGILGSTAERTVRYSEVPVMVVK